MEPTVPNKILERIQGLIRKAESAKEAGNLQEAETFTAGIQRLLVQYNLKRADVEAHSPAEKKPITEDNLSFGDVKSDGQWELDLMSSICSNNWCYNQWNKYRKTHTIVGKSENIQVVTYLYTYLRSTLKNLSGQAYSQAILDAVDDYKVSSGGKDLIELLGGKIKAEAWLCRNGHLAWRKVYVRNWLRGAVEGIDKKLSYERTSAMRQSNSLTALMKLNDTSIELYREQHAHLSLKNVKSVDLSKGLDRNADGYGEGYKTGRNLQINKGIDTSGENKVVKLLN